MLKYIYQFNFMHVRTKRKPTQKNISKLIFSIILVFIIIAAVFSLGNIKKENFGLMFKNKDDKKEMATSTSASSSTTSTKTAIVNEYWTLDIEKVLTTKTGEKIFIEIASTSEEQEQGLSGKSKLMEFVRDQKIRTEGMLFVFSEPRVLNFWMKDMRFDLDIIWLDENLKIVHIAKNAQADSYNKQNPASSTIFSNGNNPAKYVLEINSGLSNELNLREGDTLIMQ